MFELAPDTEKLFKFGMDHIDVFSNPKYIRVRNSIVKMVSQLINNFEDNDVTKRQLKDLGMQHIHRGVKKEHFDTFAQAWFVATQIVLGNSFTPLEQHHLKLFLAGLAEAMISDNYAEQEDYLKLYESCMLSDSERELAIKMWGRYISLRSSIFGKVYFNTLFKIFPEIIDKFDFHAATTEADMDRILDFLGSRLLKKCNNFLVSLESPKVLYQLSRLARLDMGLVAFT